MSDTCLVYVYPTPEPAVPRRRCSSNYLRRNSFSMLLAASALYGGLCGDLLAQSPPVTTEPIFRIAAVPSDHVPIAPVATPTAGVPVMGEATAEAVPAELQLQAPINSTLEIRVARRPWLLEKLTGPKTEPSVKMDPPLPPAELPDPPSISRIVPKTTPDDGWFNRRRAAPSYVDVLPKEELGETQQRETQQRETQQRETQQRETQQRETQQRETQQRELMCRRQAKYRTSKIV